MGSLYTMLDMDAVDPEDCNVLIMANGQDSRTWACANILSHKNCLPKSIILYQYQDQDEHCLGQLFPKAEIICIRVTGDQASNLETLNLYSELFDDNNILIDISEIYTPDIFVLMKFVRDVTNYKELRVVYSVPFDYDFPGEPFTSFSSYYGDLITNDLIGFGGFADGSPQKMIVFLGFEGALSKKVVEDIYYSDLLLVNGLPSFFPKYKDIAMLCNYQLLTENSYHIEYVPANNPFETYNYLNRLLVQNERACIAPLSTKPVSLGVCLFALKHPNIRIVYPLSEQYIARNTSAVLQTYMYRIMKYADD